LIPWDLSCPDWEQRLRAGQSLIPSLPLIKAEADIGVRFFDALRLPDVEGTPLLADAAGPWFREIVRALFGSWDPVARWRYIREIFALVGKGNSKTTYGAGLMLTALLMNKRPNADFLFVGPRQAIADRAFAHTKGMIELSRPASERFHVQEHLKTIRDRVNGSTLRIKTFDMGILTGAQPAGVLLDELHLLGRNAATERVLRQIRGGLEKSPEAFLVTITTASDEPPVGAFRDELNAARAIRDGARSGRTLPVLYELPDSIAKQEERPGVPAQWENPKNWPMVMPNLGRSLIFASVLQDWETEKAKGEANKRIWASQHLNLEMGIGLKTQRWRGVDYWLGAADLEVSFETILAQCEVACIGIDGGGLDDLLGLAVLGRERDTNRWLAWGKAWAHTSVLEQRKGEEARLRDFEARGELVIVDDMDEAFHEAAGICAEVDSAGILAKVGMDPMGVGAIVDALAENGISGNDRVVGIPQGWQLNGAIKTAEVKLANKTMAHGAQAIMGWAVGNAKVEPKGNAVTITKAVAGSGKIDPLMALLDAVVLMSKNPEAMGSPYSDGRGLMTF